MLKHICVMFLLSAVSFSETAIQTDWSGGDGVSGPVVDWGNHYFVSCQVDSSGGTLKLNRTILEFAFKHNVNSDFDGAYSVCTADVDGDGDNDILGAAYYASDIIWWENTDGSGTSWIEHTVDGDFTGAVSVYAADIDDDEDIDVLGAAMDADAIAWWENSDGYGTSWVEHTVDGGFLGAVYVYSEDVNADGYMDVLGAAYNGGDITWWENADSTGTSWIEHTVDSDFGGAVSVFAADINDDDNMDVLGTAFYADAITWWENTDSTGTVWTEHNIDDEYDGAYSVHAADIDGDSDLDVLGAAYRTHVINWWENTDGSGLAFTEHIIANSFKHAVSVFGTDIDSDGDMDVLGASEEDDEIAWWENTDGSGTVWTKHTVDGEFDGAWSVCAGFINSDDDMDIMGAAVIADEITWWEVTGYPSEGILESSILDVGSIDTWDVFSSSSQEPANTSAAFQFRSSSNSASMGAWSDTIFSTGTSLSGILSDSTRYLQYRVILETSDPVSSPVLEDVEFIYTILTGIEAGNSDEITKWSLMIPENPCYGSLSALISVPEPGLAEIAVYDLTGHTIAEYSEVFSKGFHSVNFDGLTGGVYFCVMSAGDCIATERVVVLR